MDNQEMLFELIRDVDKKQDDIIRSLVKMESNISVNTTNLQEHMSRTATLERLVLQHKQESDKRLEYLEKPVLTKLFTKRNVKWVLGIISAILGIWVSVKQFFGVN